MSRRRNSSRGRKTVNWRRFKVTFLEPIATHSTEQTFYFDRQGLLKRHDYDVDVAGGAAGAYYGAALTDVSGIVVPTAHTIWSTSACRKLGADAGHRSIDISEIQFK